MARFTRFSLLTVAVCALAAPLLAADGVLIVEKTTTGGKTTTHQIQIEKTRMRAETAGPGGDAQVIVFDGTKQVMWIIHNDKKTYNEITKADVDAMGDQMAGMMAQMQEQMKNMPPAQRAQMEAMMRGRMGGAMPAAPAKPDYRKAGTDKVGKWTCDKYEGYQNDQKNSEVCTVDPSALGFGASDFEVTRQLGEFFKKLAPQNAQQMFSVGKAEEQGFSGVPVKRVSGMGERQVITEMSEVTRQSFSAPTFEVPAGFQKEAIGFGGRRGR